MYLGPAFVLSKMNKMNRGKDFLTIRDLMKLLGTKYYNSAQRRHKAIREAIRPGKKSLTIGEYCEWENEEPQVIKKLIERL